MHVAGVSSTLLFLLTAILSIGNTYFLPASIAHIQSLVEKHVYPQIASSRKVAMQAGVIGGGLILQCLPGSRAVIYRLRQLILSVAVGQSSANKQRNEGTGPAWQLAKYANYSCQPKADPSSVIHKSVGNTSFQHECGYPDTMMCFNFTIHVSEYPYLCRYEELLGHLCITMMGLTLAMQIDNILISG